MSVDATDEHSDAINVLQLTQRYFPNQLIFTRLCSRLRLYHRTTSSFKSADTSQFTSVFEYVNPVRVVRLFYLQDTLRPEAEQLKTFFLSNGAVNPARIALLTFNDLTALMDLDDDDPSSQLYSDVVVILGHSNVFGFGSLAISDILKALVHPSPPSFVVFLGCCGGNPRYGPLKMLSLLPEWQNTICGFFQRRIYKDELCHTVPVLAIKYYLSLQIELFEIETEKLLISYCISHAYADRYKCDSACFLNPKIELSPAQEFLGIVTNYAIAGINISTKEVPPSCWQLAMYHNFTVEKQEFRNFVVNTAARLESKIVRYQRYNMCNTVLKEILIAEVDKICKAELKEKKLWDIVELACEIQFLRVTKETFTLLRSNKWNEVDHLQFFVAMLHGYWGKNDYHNLIQLAADHLRETMKLMHISPNKDNLHKYHLCCVGFCLFSPHADIVFAASVDQMPKFSVQVRQIIIPTPSVTALPINKDELPWVDFFDLCKTDYRFVELFNDKIPHVSRHSFLKDMCKCKRAKQKCKYQYTKEDLKGALEALKDSLVPSDDPPSYFSYYKVKSFENKEDEGRGYMQCFPLGFTYSEMRIIEEPITDQEVYMEKWNQVSRCRFVFEFHQHVKTIYGRLYFTDSHYGEDKIPRLALEKILYVQIFEEFNEELTKKYRLQTTSLQPMQEKQETLIEKLLQEPRLHVNYSEMFKRLIKHLSNVSGIAIYIDKNMSRLIQNLSSRVENHLRLNYFQLFKKLKISKRSKYKLQKELLEIMHKELVKKFNDEVDEYFGSLSQLNSVQLRALLVFTRVPVRHLNNAVLIVRNSVLSLKEEFARQTEQRLISNLSGLEDKFIEILKRSTQDQDLNNARLQNQLVQRLQNVISNVEVYFDNKDFYPFVEIGFLTLPRYRDPYLANAEHYNS